MEAQQLLSPLYAASVVGLSVLAFAGGRTRLTRAWTGWPLTWAALGFAGAGLFLAQRLGWTSAVLLRGAGVFLLVGAAWCAHRASLSRRRSELLMGARPAPVDQALSALAQVSEPAVVRGRLGARQQVTSPGGIVCATFEARVHGLEESGERGALIAQERAGADWLYVQGERERLAVRREEIALWAPEQIRRCGAPASLQLAEVLADGAPPADALSYERVAKLGEECLALGRLARTDGGVELVGVHGGGPLLVVGGSLTEAAQVLARKAWKLYATAAAFCALSAVLLSLRG